jgi:pilus assembly protein Flp/PilA
MYVMRRRCNGASQNKSSVMYPVNLSQLLRRRSTMITYYYLILQSYVEDMKSYLKREEGQDLIEYALIAGLLALAAVTALIAMRGSLQGIWTNLQSALSDAASQATR